MSRLWDQMTDGARKRAYDGAGQMLGKAMAELRESRAENARLREALEVVLSNPSDDPQDAVEVNCFLLTPKQIAWRNAQAALGVTNE